MQISSHLSHRTRFRFSPWVMAELRPRILRLSPASRDGDTTPEHGALGRLCWKRRVGREVWGKGGGEGKTHPDTAGRSLQRPGPAFGAGRRRGGTGRGLPSAGPGGARQGGGFSFVSGCAAGDGTGRNKNNRPAPGWRRDSRACGASRLRPRARAVRRGQRREGRPWRRRGAEFSMCTGVCWLFSSCCWCGDRQNGFVLALRAVK